MRTAVCAIHTHISLMKPLYLAEKKLVVNEAGQTNDYISYSQFCKDKLPDCSFTFWDWFHGIMKLTKQYFQQIWKNGHIVGFISKRKTKEILAHQAMGTFLLRFSDSTKGNISFIYTHIYIYIYVYVFILLNANFFSYILGGITIAYRDYCGNIIFLAPWTSNNLHIRSLADSIRDLDVLRIVYPTMLPSNAAFSSSPTTQNGYYDDIYIYNTVYYTYIQYTNLYIDILLHRIIRNYICKSTYFIISATTKDGYVSHGIKVQITTPHSFNDQQT